MPHGRERRRLKHAHSKGPSGLKHMELTQGLAAMFLVGEQVLMTCHAEENVGVQEIEGKITFSEFRKSKMDYTRLSVII